MSLIDLSKFAADFPADEGDTTRVEHCVSGKRKLYITRTSDGVVGFCHHCGTGGYSREQTALSLEPEFPSAPRPNSSENVIDWAPAHYHDMPVVPFDKLSKEIRIWWFSAGLNVSEYSDLSIRCSSSSSVTLPLRDSLSGNVTGTATRNFKPGAPKWVLAGSKVVAPFTRSENPGNLIVITEDYLSALRCSRHCYALPIMGTNMSLQNRRQALQWFTGGGRGLVWLDNDSPSVVRQAKAAQRALRLFNACDIVLVPSEPKHYINDRDLVAVLKL